MPSLPFRATKESERQKEGEGYLCVTLLSVTYMVSGSELIQDYKDIWYPTLNKCISILACNVSCILFDPIHTPISSPSEFPHRHCLYCQETEKKQELVKKMVTVIICVSENVSPTIYVDKISTTWTHTYKEPFLYILSFHPHNHAVRNCPESQCSELSREFT